MSTLFTQGHAIVIGVGADLPNTLGDAEGLSDILKNQERCSYPEKQVRLLTSKGATRTNILSALDELSGSVGSDSSVLVYFSGHGYRVTGAGVTNYYLMPYGYDTKRIQETAISGEEFTAKLRAIKAKKMLLLLDCCHAGGVGVTKSLQGEVVGHPPNSEMVKSPMPPEANDLLAQGSGWVIIASSMEKEVSYAGEPYSAFTAALIEALCGRGVAVQDGYVRVSDLARYTGEMVPKRTRDRQHPILHFEHADNFKVAYYAGGDDAAKAPPFEEPKIEPHPGAWNNNPQIVWNISDSAITNVGRDLRYTAGNSYEYNAKEDLIIAQGSVYKAGGDMFVGAPANAPSDPLAEIFAELKGRVKSLPPDDQRLISLLLDEAHAHATKIQQGNGTTEIRSALEKRLKSLLTEARGIGDETLERLATSSATVSTSIQEIARRLKAGA